MILGRKGRKAEKGKNRVRGENGGKERKCTLNHSFRRARIPWLAETSKIRCDIYGTMASQTNISPGSLCKKIT